MKKTVRATAWMFILAHLFAGCYSAAVIDMEGSDGDSIDPERIDYVLMKDATRVEFDTTPAVSQDAITGISDGLRVTLPLSEVSLVRMKRSFDGTTTFLAAALVGLIGVAVGVAVSGQ